MAAEALLTGGRVWRLVSGAVMVLGVAAAAVDPAVPAADSTANRVAGEGGGVPTIVFVLRHAEKKSDDARDPELSPAGVERAGALARLLEPAGVTHLYASEYRRTRQTLEPLARRIGRDIEVVEAGRTDQLVARIDGLPAGSVAVVAGHANTVPHLVKALGGEVDGLIDSDHGPLLDEAIYHRLFQVILPPGRAVPPGGRKVTTLELHYGR